MTDLTAKDAAQELLLRRRMRESLVEYARAVPVPGRPVTSDEDSAFAPIETTLAKHHILLLNAWQRMTETRYGRLMVLMPPGSAKSTFASVVGPAWWLSNKPGRRCILTSYGDDLARKHGRRTRQLLRDQRHSATFECTLSPESHAANEFALTNGSEYMSAGILGAVTGNRAGGLVIDDPYKGRQDADSDTVRSSIQSAYEDDLSTRLYPGAWICLILTRWHEDDLAGRILPSDWKGGSGDILGRDGQTWHVLCLQAECDVDNDPLGRKRGEYLWPEWFDERHWLQYKGKARTWASLYQQMPSTQEGLYFKREWFRRYLRRPEHLHVYCTSDHAPAGEDHSDSNIFRVWGVDPAGDIYLLDGFRAKCTMDKFTERALPLIKRYDPFCWFPEDDNNWKSVAGFVSQQMLASNTYCRIEPISPHGADKEVKAQAIQAMASMGKLYIPEGYEGDQVINEYCKFPAGGKDETDAAATLGRAIKDAHPAILPRSEAKPERTDRWDRVFDDASASEEWRIV